MANLETLELTISGSADKASQGIGKLITSLGFLDKAVGTSISGLKRLNEELKTLKGFGAIKLPNLGKVTGATATVARAKKVTEEEIKAWQAAGAAKRTFTNGIGFDTSEQAEAERRARNPQWYQDPVEQARKAQQYLKENGGVASWAKDSEKAADGVKEKLQQVGEESRKTKTELKSVGKEGKKGLQEVGKEAEETKEKTKSIKEAFADAFGGIANFISKVKRIAVTMLIRNAIKAMIKSVKEGISNVYQWSKMVKGSFAEAMDSAATKVQTLKNSFGAAMTSLLQAIIPVFNSIISVVTQAVNILNQFFALLTGQGYWTHAIDNATEYEQAATGASNANKELLASFDELNVISSEGGGGGSGGSKQDYSNMFENLTVFDETIREIVDFLKENFNSIVAIVAAIGAGILAWKVSTAFSGIVSTLAGFIATGVPIVVTAQLSWMLTNQYLDTGKPGWLIAEMLTTGLGTTAAWAIAKKLIGGQAGTWAAVITLAFSAIAGITASLGKTDVGALSKESITVGLENALKIGGAAGILLKFVKGEKTLVAAGKAGLGALAVFGCYIGLKASLDPNIQFFSLQFVVPAIIGAASTALGVMLISGNPYIAAGAAVISLFAMVAIKLSTNKEHITWGNRVLTAEEIQEVVKKKIFTPTAEVEISQFNTKIAEKNNLQTSIEQSLNTIDVNWNLLSLGLDKEETLGNIRKAISGENGEGGEGTLVGDIAAMSNINISELKLTYGSMTIYGENGMPIGSDTLFAGVEGWQNITKAVQKDGQELTRLLFEGAKRELTPEEDAYLQELLERTTGWASKIASSKEFSKLRAEFETNVIKALSEGSFKGVIEEWETYSKENENSIRTAIKEQIANWYQLADLTNDPELKAKYIKIAQETEAGMELTVREELRKRNAPGRQMLMEWFFGNHETGTVSFSQSWIDNILADWGKDLDSSSAKFSEQFREWMNEMLLDSGWDSLEIDAMNLIGFYGWDFLSEEVKEQLRNALQIHPEDIAKLRDELQISANELVDIINWKAFSDEQRSEMVKSLVSAYGSDEAIQAIKDRLPNYKPEMFFKDIDFSKFTTDQRMQFINSISKAYGSDEALKAAKAAGIDVGAWVSEGLKSKDPEIVKIAQNWTKIIEGEKPDIEVEAHLKDGTAKNIKDAIEGIDATITAKVALDKSADAIKKAIEAIKPSVVITIKNLNEIAQGIADAISKIKIKVNNGSVSATTKANGGLVNSGDIFIANENGKSEMIGRFGNQTAVANQEQMVEAMARGVQYAQSEQNGLLREQNSLLRAILAKEMNVNLGASSALGRTVKKSLEMYGTMTGG